MVTSLFRYERIRTTKAKASAIRRTAEKMITRAKVDSVHNRRMVARDIKDKAILAKLFTDLGPRFQARPGGYTRMLKIGQRRGDASEMVLLELVEEELENKDTGSSAKKSDSKKKAEPKKKAASKSATAETKSDDEPKSEKKSDSKKSESKKTEAKATEKPADEEATETQDDGATGANDATSNEESDAETAEKKEE
jgi:large subunit ribosomal protein L17